MNPADAFITTDSYCSAEHSNNSSTWEAFASVLLWNKAENYIRIRKSGNPVEVIPIWNQFAITVDCTQ